MDFTKNNFPSILYRDEDGEKRLVATLEDAIALGSGWTDSPYTKDTVEPPPPDPIVPPAVETPKAPTKKRRVRK